LIAALPESQAPITDVIPLPNQGLAYASEDATLTLFNERTGDQKHHRFPWTLRALAATPRGLAAGDQSGNLWLFHSPKAKTNAA